MSSSLTCLSAEQFGEVFARMKQDFPPIERPPKWLFCKRIAQGWWECVVLRDDEGEIQAYAIAAVGTKSEHLLLLYLAVSSAQRGQGIGTRFMELLFDRYKDCQSVIVEVERVEEAKTEEQSLLRQKRIVFYERLGFARLPVFYKLMGMPMHLLCRGKIPPKEDVQGIILDAYHAKVQTLSCKNFVCVPED